MSRIAWLLLGLLIGAVNLLAQSGPPPQTLASQWKLPTESVDIDLPPTDMLTRFVVARSRELLFRQLCANSRWSVTDQAGNAVAKLCEAPELGDVHIELRFSGRNVGTPRIMLLGHFTPVAPGTQKTSLGLWPVNDGMESTVWMHAGDQLILAVREISPDRTRAHTQQAIALVMKEFAAVLEVLNTIEQKGYAPAITPAEGIYHGMDKPGLVIEPTDFNGIYNVYGYLNEKEAGIIHVRLVDPVTGEVIAKEKNDVQTARYVGWSSEPNTRFRFKVTVSADGAWKGERRLRTEVLFLPVTPRVVETKEFPATSWTR